MAVHQARTFRDTLLAAGATARLIASRDWRTTSLGAIETWPQSLRTLLAFLLRSPVPMVLLWGADGVMLYNDAYAVFAGGRHPALLGSNVREGWPEVADFNDNVMRVGLAGGTLAYKDQELTLHRYGGPEQVFMNLDYSPVEDESGRPAGVMAVVIETTELVVARRRREAAEAALRAERDRAKGVLDNMGEAFVLLDDEFRLVDINAEALRLDNRPREAILGKRYEEAHPDADPALGRLYRQAMAERRAVSLEHRYVWPDGRTIWIDMRAYPVEGGLAVFYRDVTGRHHAEDRLREETRTLETLNRTGAALAGELDLERLVQAVTDAGVELTGARFGAYFHNIMDETGERLHLFTLSGAERAAFEAMGRPRATAIFGPTFRNEGIIRSSDILADPRYGRNAPHRGMPEGHLPVRSYLALPVVSRSGEVLGGLLFGHPEPGRFTERHERLMAGLAAQAAVAVDNARLFGAVQRANETLERRVEERTAERNRVWAMSRDLLAVMGFDGWLKAINPAWETTLGFDRNTLLARPLAQQVHSDDQAAAGAVLERLRRGETVARFEDRLRHADGSWRWIAWGLVPEGEVFYAIGRDVTAEKQAAAELELAQDALRQAQKMEAVGQLTGGIAHDFNNLLGAVVGSFDLIRRKPADVERVKRLADAGLQAAERGAKLTGQLLAFSRAQRIELKPLVVSAVVAGMEDLLARTLGPTVRLTLRLDTDEVPVLCDATQLEMAVLNLAINARDAMPEGGDLTLTTVLRRVDGDAELRAGGYVELSVADTGSGMPPDVAARAFDPFFTTKGVGKGTGLGLSQVYGIARQAGGAVRIESREGLGTAVRILLPRTEAPVRAGGAAADAGDAPAGSGATILVVDDDAELRRVLADALDALGYRVVQAGDGPAGLAALDAEAPDLMMVDFAMPGMNGAEVATAARRRRPDLPIVFASGYADTAAIERAAGPGATVLRKPFRVAELQAVLAAALNPAI